MSDGTYARGIWSSLAELGVLRIAGADAAAFLQGQLSNDIERLDRERTLLCALNTAQGRVVAILRLVQRHEGIHALLPAALIPSVIERLKKYVLRAKVTLTDESARWAVAGLLDVNTPADAAALAREDVSVHSLPGIAGRHVLVGPTAGLASLAAGFSEKRASSDRWRLAAIESGEPQVYPQTSDVFVAQMLNLDLVDAVSFTKGCYTGQEIIARTQHRGRIKRRMLRYRVRGSGRLSPGDNVNIDQRSGRVVEFASTSETDGELLAVMALEVAPRTAHGELSAERLPLPYSIPDLD
jgi:folate-binding protein YgfZ